MALFDFFKKRKEKERFEKKRRKKETAEKPVVLEREEKKKEPSKQKPGFKERAVVSDLVFRTLISPHITEKTTMNAERAVVFKAKARSNKIMIKKAVEELYGVHVRKVNISKSPSKKRFVRGKYGVKPGYKKAIVYLKKGEKIEL